MKRILAITAIFLSFLTASADKTGKERPDLDAIRAAVNDPNSRFHYPRLLAMFLSNDTVMTNEQYRYFYYGTMFQEDYDPYRAATDPERLQSLQQLYTKKGDQLTRAERQEILAYAEDALKDNPLDLTQLKYRVVAYDLLKKENLSKIWKSKLNHLLYTIASSGSGLITDEAWLVVYPSHEVEFLNFQSLGVTAMEYIMPHYEYVMVRQHSDKDPPGYYFDLGPMLEQYYLKHPSENN